MCTFGRRLVYVMRISQLSACDCIKDFIVNIMWRVEPLLCNVREMGGYTRPVSGQRLLKHVPIARQQINNNATVGLQQWESSVFCVVRAERL
jgi:hypothetical protein